MGKNNKNNKPNNQQRSTRPAKEKKVNPNQIKAVVAFDEGTPDDAVAQENNV